MNDVYKVFDDNLQTIIQSVNLESLDACYTISFDLSVFSTLSKYPDGVLLGEVLCNVFLDIKSAFSKYEIEPQEVDQTLVDIREGLSDILRYHKQDPNKIYAALKKVQFASSKFYLESRRKQERILE